MGAFADERRAIEERLSANWSATPIRFENVPFQEIQNDYIACFIRSGEGRQISISNTPLTRFAGVIIIQIFVKADKGTQQARLYADQLDPIFRNQTFSAGVSGLIRCWLPSLVPVGTAHGWYQMNLEIPYWRDKVY